MMCNKVILEKLKETWNKVENINGDKISRTLRKKVNQSTKVKRKLHREIYTWCEWLVKTDY